MSSRREAIKNMAVGAVGMTGLSSFAFSEKISSLTKEKVLKGNINHSVSRWTYNYLTLDELCKAVKEIGFSAIDLTKPSDWPTMQKHGIYASMCYTNGDNNLNKGLNNPVYHEQLIKEYLEVIPVMANSGYKNLICFTGQRQGMDDETGMKNCMKALEKILPVAEKNNVTMVMELLNSKIDHKDYMCNHVEWGAELCKRINSNNFKLLYDI